MLDFIILCAVRAGSDGVNDRGGHEGEGGAGDGAHQGDEQVQLGDGGGQAEGEEDEAEPEEELGLQVFLWRYSGPEVGVDDVHRHIEHDHVGGEGGEGHGDFDQGSEAAQSNDSCNLTEGSNLQLVSGEVQ